MILEGDDIHIYTKRFKFGVDTIYYKYYIQYRDKTVWNAEIEEYSNDVSYTSHERALEAAIQYYKEHKEDLYKLLEEK